MKNIQDGPKRNALDQDASKRIQCQYSGLSPLLILLIFCGFGPVHVFGRGYEAKGTVSHAVYDTSGNPIQEKQRTFTVKVSGKLWWIRTEVSKPPQQLSTAEIAALEQSGIVIYSQAPVYGGTDGAQLAMECSSDGNFIYIKRIFVKDAKQIELAKKSDSKHLGVLDQVEVIDNILPSFNSELYFPVWLAFCSQNYLQQQETYSPPLIWLNYIPEKKDGREYRLVSRLNCLSEDCFIADVLFENRGYFCGVNASKPRVQALPSSANAPYMEGRYQVLRWGKLKAQEYPELGQLEIYPFGMPISAPARAVMRATVSVESFKISDPDTDGLVSVTSPTRVLDHRLTVAGKPMLYVTTNTIAQPRSARAEKLKADMSRNQALRQGTSDSRQFVRIVVVTSIAASLVALLAFVKWNNKKTRKPIRTNNENKH